MIFQFNIVLTEEDYLNFNYFHNLRSDFGKRSIKNFRILTVCMFFFFLTLSLLRHGLTTAVFVYVFISVVLNLLIVPIVKMSVRGSIQAAKKSGRLGYDPYSTLEFYDDFLTEITEKGKQELKYFAVEKIHVVNGKYIYVYTSSVMAFIIPFSAFVSLEHYNAFMSFLSSKGKEIVFHS